MKGRGAVHSLSPGLVAGIPNQPGVQLKTRGLESFLGCCDHLHDGQKANQQTRNVGNMLCVDLSIVFCGEEDVTAVE